MSANSKIHETFTKLTLLNPSHSVDVLAAPSHLLMRISFAVDPNSRLLNDLLGFHPNGLSEIPLYKDMETVESGLSILAGFLREELLEGGIGAPVIVKAKDILIFILADRRISSIYTFPSRARVTALCAMR
jgi:hypothetical protein